MNVKDEIRTDLWHAIEKTYESNIFTGAILDAIHYLSDVIRERANIDGDGASLIGQAFGGSEPVLRINKFQTETEKNEQKGFEQLLRGVYQAIRNPRSHEQIEDNKETADAIIIFINYIANVISEAKEPFTIKKWIDRVYDNDFVPSKRYAILLAKEVPPKKLEDAMIAIYRKKAQGDGSKLKYIIESLIDLIGEKNIDNFLDVVSDDLSVINNNSELITVLAMFPPHLWPRIKEIARIRIENKLIQSIEAGEYDIFGERCISGHLGTWATNLINYFTLNDELIIALTSGLQASNDQANYVAKYFFWDFIKLVDETTDKDGDKYYLNYTVKVLLEIVNDPGAPQVLREKFLQKYNFPKDWQKKLIDEIDFIDENKDPDYFQKFINAVDDFPF